jgi:hypothetical protein
VFVFDDFLVKENAFEIVKQSIERYQKTFPKK